ncbi:MAG: MBL fold metallo-hydrolase [Actinobacteria bacterium]|nr:MBL fold metallo-hydrolase [Actinomycetota bacterium]
MNARGTDATIVDTRLAAITGLMAAYVIAGDQPVVVDPGAQTTAGHVRRALERQGIAPGDLAWIVLTHVHLDHCGATGDLCAAFPNARVVVHPRGARHICAPERLVAASRMVYGRQSPVYGGLRATPVDRVIAADDGHRVPIGPGRALTMIGAPGHARHHMAVLDAWTGTLFAGDAFGARLGGAGLHPTIPPPDFDPVASTATLGRLAALSAERVAISHFGVFSDVEAMVADALETQARITACGPQLRRAADVSALAPLVERILPSARPRATAAGRARWDRLGWIGANVDGVASWLDRRAR